MAHRPQSNSVARASGSTAAIEEQSSSRPPSRCDVCTSALPRTGTYAVQGEDELKGFELAVEHINTGHELIRKIAPKISKGVLGKQVNLVVSDSAAKPNQAVQEQQRFISENKIVLMTGSTSSAAESLIV
jgi:ABC-type branched-subunit amino acid transport system substrate-binding protein